MLAGSERGSLVIALAVLVVGGLLVAALLTRTYVAMASVRHQQDEAAALAAADGGLSDLLFRLDQSPATSRLEESGTFGGSSFSYVATRVDANTWTAVVTGVINGEEHTIAATLARDPDYPFAIFSDRDLSLNGNGGPNIYSYSSQTGAMFTGHAVVGSNHAIVINGGGGGDAQRVFTPDGSCTGCPHPEELSGPRPLPAPPPPTTYQACPQLGIFPLIVDGRGGVPFVCTSDIVFPAGAVTIANPPAIVYVAADAAVDISSSMINLNGRAADFRILKAGTGSFTIGNGAHAGRLFGVIYAPQTDLTVNGGEMYMDGSLTVASLTINGNPNFEFAYDDSILDVSTGPWQVRDWREVPR